MKRARQPETTNEGAKAHPRAGSGDEEGTDVPGVEESKGTPPQGVAEGSQSDVGEPKPKRQLTMREVIDRMKKRGAQGEHQIPTKHAKSSGRDTGEGNTDGHMGNTGMAAGSQHHTTTTGSHGEQHDTHMGPIQLTGKRDGDAHSGEIGHTQHTDTPAHEDSATATTGGAVPTRKKKKTSGNGGTDTATTPHPSGPQRDHQSDKDGSERDPG